jgi:NAD(P)-dependent dehydrogenase (short-subunit alcohol dehydrogenase family)
VSGLILWDSFAHQPSNVQFVKCDTRDWDEQVDLFKKAKTSSPAKSVDIVIANAGVSGPDEIFASSGLEGRQARQLPKRVKPIFQ